MGTWSEDIFGNDMACDVRDAYRERIAAGDDAATALKRVKREMAMPSLDADEKRTVWIALAAAQQEAGKVAEDVRAAALKAIAWCELPDRDPEQFPFGLETLVKLREKLGGKPPLKSAKPPKPKVLPGEMGDVCAIALSPTGFCAEQPKGYKKMRKRITEAVVFVGGPSGHDRSVDSGRVVLLPDLAVADVTPYSVASALSEWRQYYQKCSNGLGASIGCYDAAGKLPSRKTRVLLRGIPMPKDFARRMEGLGAVYKSSDLPYILDRALWEWNEYEWAVDPKEK
jgi:hypothetical protein